MTMTSWSELAEDIIGLFADRLPYIKDFVRFGSVSRSWRSAAIQAKGRRKPSEPWLVLATRENDKISGEEGGVRSCYSLFSNKVFNLYLPELQGRRCWGTQYGWIITLGLDSEYHLFNPLTRTRFSLPHRSTFPDQGDYDNAQHMCRGFPGKFALSSDPTESGESVVVMAMYAGRRELAFASPSHKSWTCLNSGDCFAANDDVIFFVDRFFSISVRGVLRVCDINTAEPKVEDIGPHQFDDLAAEFYLAEISGDLHLIVRHFNFNEDEEDHEETYRFNLYKFDFHETQWVEVNDFGNHSLFVGNNTTFAISASDYPDFKFKSNCIYFTDDQPEYFDKKYCDMGVYDMGTGTLIEPFYKQVDLPSLFSRPFIFVPTLV